VATILVVDDSPTIRQVVATVLEGRGYDTLSATDGQDALGVLEEGPVDMVLLDFVMPVMNGYQFCRHLRSDPRFERLPVVLMSAKGDKIRGQFVQQTGAVDAITKPFDPRALVAVVESALARAHRESTAPPAPDEQDRIDVDALRALKDTNAREAGVRQALVSSLLRSLAPKLRNDANLTNGDVEALLAEALERPNLKEYASLFRVLDSNAPGENAVLSGDLSFISIAEVMQMLELQRQTGALTIENGNRSIKLFLSDGRIDLGKTENLALSFRIGRFLVEDGVLTREQLEPFLVDENTKNLLGEALTEQGLATSEQVQKALRRQTSEIVYEAVRWKSGRFTFENGEGCPEATLAGLALAPGGLLMEGFRRIDEWQLIEGSFKFDDVLKPDENVILRSTGRDDWTDQEKRVLDAVDGKRTVRQIVDHVEASTFDTCKILYQLLKSRLIRRLA
jgi:CheY-like chemotaxis protein